MSQRRTLRHPAEPGHSTAKRISDGITSVKTIVMKQNTGRASNGDQSLLNVRDAASFLGLSKRFLHKARILGDGPHSLTLGPRVLSRTEDNHAWIASRIPNGRQPCRKKHR